MSQHFPIYHQHDKMDCGPTCLRMIAKYYGKTYSLQTIREKCYITKNGVSMLGISDAAESIGFRTMGTKLIWEQLKKEISLPCIAHWNYNHFVVVYAIDKKERVIVADPAIGLLKYSKDDFLKGWLKTNKCGLTLILEPSPVFYKNEYESERKNGINQILQYLRPYRSFFIQILLAMLVASVITFLLPIITQSVVDVGIGTGNLSFVTMLLIAQLLLSMGGMANNLIRSWLMLHTTTRISISLISDFLCKLMKLPIAFFDSKMVGDIMQRIGDYNRIQSFMTSALLSMIIAVVSLIVYGIIMAGYNTAVFAIFIIGSSFFIGWVLLFMRRRKELDYMNFQQASANQSNIVQLISGMQDIKLNNCERQKRWDWEAIQAKLFKLSIKSLSLGQIQEVGSVFIDQGKNIFISFLSAKAVIDGDMTLGMMMSLQYIMGQINAPIAQFIGFAQSAQDASISWCRLCEIHEMKDEENEGESIKDIPDGADILFRNVDFYYGGPDSEKILDNISLTIPAKKVTAIVGASGSGKTTLLKIMLGFYRPISGEVLLGKIPLKNYSIRCWREWCGSVMQEGYIFSDSIASNISISDTHPDMVKVKEAARISNLSEWVENLPHGFNTKIGADGRGLSTGQKQRLQIARVAYKDAKYLFLDEATNSLDASNEKVIMDNLSSLFRNRTVVVVAHRLSTVMNADNIIVLDKGRIVEQGTHMALVEKKGKYFELVRHQLEN